MSEVEEAMDTLVILARHCPGADIKRVNAAEDTIVARLATADRDTALRGRVEMLRAKYTGRSAWVGYEPSRREAWSEIERDLRAALDASPTGTGRDAALREAQVAALREAQSEWISEYDRITRDHPAQRKARAAYRMASELAGKRAADLDAGAGTTGGGA